MEINHTESVMANTEHSSPDFIAIPPINDFDKRNPITEVIKFGVGGVMFGVFVGTVVNYNKVVHVFNRRDVVIILREAYTDAKRPTLFLGLSAFLYSLANEVSILLRGADYWTPAFGGSLAGFVLSRMPNLKITPGRALPPRTTLSFMGFGAFGGIAADSARYNPRTKSHFYLISHAQRSKVMEAYTHAMNKAKRQNEQRHADLEAASAKYAKFD